MVCDVFSFCKNKFMRNNVEKWRESQKHFSRLSSGNKKEFHRTFDTWNNVTKSTVAMRFFDIPIQFLIIYFPGGSTMMDSVSSTCLQKIPYLLEPQLIKKQGGIWKSMIAKNLMTLSESKHLISKPYRYAQNATHSFSKLHLVFLANVSTISRFHSWYSRKFNHIFWKKNFWFGSPSLQF